MRLSGVRLGPSQRQPSRLACRLGARFPSTGNRLAPSRAILLVLHLAPELALQLVPQLLIELALYLALLLVL